MQASHVKEQEKIEKDRELLVNLCNKLLKQLYECKGQVRIAEKFINDLKATGEESVEDLIDQLTKYCKSLTI